MCSTTWALLYYRRGDYARAESQYLKALAIRERTRGADDPSVAETLANVGGVYYSSGQYDKAVQVLQRALGIQETLLPPNHPSLATSSFNLAAVYFDQGNYRNAEPLFQRALAIDEQALDPQHPRLATRLVGLAEVLRLKGEYARADPLYERALAIRERALGPAHPDVAATLIARSLLRYATGDFDGATELMSRGAELREDTLALVLTTGSEEQKRLYLRTLVDETDIAISLHLGSAPTSPAAARLALTNILQRKGRSIDAMADQIATLRRRLNDADREVLNQLSAGTVPAGHDGPEGSGDRRAAAVGDGAAARDPAARTDASAPAASEFRVASRKATLREIQDALPGGTALIEFVSYRPFSVRNARDTAFGAPRYAAYVLRSDGIAAQRRSGRGRRHRSTGATVSCRRCPIRRSGGARGRRARCTRRVMAPLQDSLRDVEQIIISPDGALNLIPFSALVGQNDTLSGRALHDLLRDERPRSDPAPGLRARPLTRAAAPPIIVANPLFDRLRVASAACRDQAGSHASLRRARARAEPPVQRPSRYGARSRSAGESAA